MVAELQRCIVNHLDELQEGPYHAAWKEVRNPLETMGVSLITRPEARNGDRPIVKFAKGK